MIVKDKARQQAEAADLEGAKFHKFNDTVTIEGTGVYSNMPKGKQYKNVHRLTANELVRKKYASIV